MDIHTYDILRTVTILHQQLPRNATGSQGNTPALAMTPYTDTTLKSIYKIQIGNSAGLIHLKGLRNAWRSSEKPLSPRVMMFPVAR